MLKTLHTIYEAYIKTIRSWYVIGDTMRQTHGVRLKPLWKNYKRVTYWSDKIHFKRRLWMLIAKKIWLHVQDQIKREQGSTTAYTRYSRTSTSWSTHRKETSSLPRAWSKSLAPSPTPKELVLVFAPSSETRPSQSQLGNSLRALGQSGEGNCLPGNDSSRAETREVSEGGASMEEGAWLLRGFDARRSSPQSPVISRYRCSHQRFACKIRDAESATSVNVEKWQNLAEKKKKAYEYWSTSCICDQADDDRLPPAEETITR